jgi:ribosome-associated heat shock protein Hsp15
VRLSYTRNAEVCIIVLVSRDDARDPNGGEPGLETARLDVWLDVACLFRTRSEAQKAAKTGKIEVNGQPAKAHRMLHVGDRLEIGRPFGRKQTVVVKRLVDKHVAKADARLLYDDETPKPTAEEIEMRRMERMFRAAVTPPTTPDRRARRALRKLKEGE